MSYQRDKFIKPLDKDIVILEKLCSALYDSISTSNNTYMYIY